MSRPRPTEPNALRQYPKKKKIRTRFARLRALDMNPSTTIFPDVADPYLGNSRLTLHRNELASYRPETVCGADVQPIQFTEAEPHHSTRSEREPVDLV